jgi:hypothetical protein
VVQGEASTRGVIFGGIAATYATYPLKIPPASHFREVELTRRIVPTSVEPTIHYRLAIGCRGTAVGDDEHEFHQAVRHQHRLGWRDLAAFLYELGAEGLLQTEIDVKLQHYRPFPW